MSCEGPPSDRWQTAAEVQARLEALQDFALDGSASGQEVALARPGQLMPRAAWLALALTIGLGGAATWWTLGRNATSVKSRPDPLRMVQRHLTRLTFDAGLQTDPTFSPDGRFIAYASDKTGNFDIWVQPIAGGNAVQITHSPWQDTEPAWSPDGNSIAFQSDREGGGIYAVPAFGGTERKLSSFGGHPSWSADGSEVRFLGISSIDGNGVTGIYAVSLNGDPPKQLLTEFTKMGNWEWIAGRPDGRISLRGIHQTLGNGFFTVSPDGTVVTSKQTDEGPLAMPYFGSRAQLRFHWSADGTTLYSEGAGSSSSSVTNLWKITVDPATLAWTSVERLTTGATSDVAATLSPDGKRVAFSERQQSERLWSFQFDSKRLKVGDGTPLSEGGGFPTGASLSPNGRIIDFSFTRLGATTTQLWVSHLDTGQSEQVDDGATSGPWSRDSRQIAYTRSREDIGLGPGWPTSALAIRSFPGQERLVSPWDTKTKLAPCDWTPDGQALLVSVQLQDGAEHLALWRLDGSTHEPETVLADARTTFWQAKYSPNGRWLSFLAWNAVGSIGVIGANERRPATWARVAPEFVSADKPRWASDGRYLFFLSSQGGSFLNLWGVAFDPDRGVPVGKSLQLSHFNSPGFIVSPRLKDSELGVSDNRVLMTMRAATGNIWMLDNVDR